MASEPLSLMEMAFRRISGWTRERAQGALGSRRLIQAWGWAGVGGCRRGSEHQGQQPSTGPGLPASPDCPTGSSRLCTPATHSRQPDSRHPEPPTCVPTSEQQRETPATRAETWHPDISWEPRDTPSTVFPGPVVAARRWRRQEGKLSPSERGGAVVRPPHSDIPGSTLGSHQVVTKCFCHSEPRDAVFTLQACCARARTTVCTQTLTAQPIQLPAVEEHGTAFSRIHQGPLS